MVSRSSSTGQPAVHRIDVERFRIEFVLEPLHELAVTFVIRVAHGLDEIHVTPGTPHVLGRGARLPSTQTG